MKIEDAIKQGKPFANPQTKAVINLTYTAAWITGLQTQLLKPYGISIQQYNILRILRGMYPDPATVKELIARMIDKNSNASRLVDKLVHKGYVERTTCATDRRRVDVAITEEGIKTLDIVSKTLEAGVFSIKLTDEEATLLSNLLDKMRS